MFGFRSSDSVSDADRCHNDSLTEITSTAAVLLAVVVESSGVFHVVG